VAHNERYWHYRRSFAVYLGAGSVFCSRRSSPTKLDQDIQDMATYGLVVHSNRHQGFCFIISFSGRAVARMCSCTSQRR